MSVSFQKLTIRLAYVREYMDVGPEIRRTRARQLGMLMQAYRRDYAVEGQTGRLSQEGLLRLMGQADPRYRDRYDRSTVARWESGEIRPTRERIEVFGRALNLSLIEVEGLISLAGPDLQNGVLQTNGPEGFEGAGEGDGAPWQAAAADNNVIPSYAGEVMRFSLFRFLLPGSCIAGAGYLLVLQGWDSAWVLMLYVGAAIGLVLAQGFLILRRSRELRELFILSVFFLHSQSLLQAPLTRMENYGFYAIGDFGGTPIPYLLALIVNLFLALAAGLMFDFFWRWQYFGDRPGAEGLPASRLGGAASHSLCLRLRPGIRGCRRLDIRAAGVSCAGGGLHDAAGAAGQGSPPQRMGPEVPALDGDCGDRRPGGLWPRGRYCPSTCSRPCSSCRTTISSFPGRWISKPWGIPWPR